MFNRFPFKVVDYDRTRNTNREALTKFKKEPLNSQKKVWVNLGDFFIKLESDNVKSYIEKGTMIKKYIIYMIYYLSKFVSKKYKTDQKNLEKEISSLRDTIKQKTSELEKL